MAQTKNPTGIIAPPKSKGDWPGYQLLLKENCPEGFLTPLPHSISVFITRRMNAKETSNTAQDVSQWGEIRILKCRWTCSVCKAVHSGFIPESWIDEGKAKFLARRH